MANGDYGEFVPQLAMSANRSLCYQTDKSTNYDADDQDTPVIKVDSLGYPDMPLLKKQYSTDGKDIIRPPSEWSKFWTLVGRCQVYYYRDWVNRCSPYFQFFFARIYANFFLYSNKLADDYPPKIVVACFVCNSYWYVVR